MGARRTPVVNKKMAAYLGQARNWSNNGASLELIPPQPKSDISELGNLRVPNSGKPEFGWEGGRPPT